MAERQGVDLAELRSTVAGGPPLQWFYTQGPIEREPRLDMATHLAVDKSEFSVRNMPKVYSTYIDGYNIRELGITAAQELAWIFGNGMEYIDHLLKRGLSIDQFGPRTTFFLSSHIDFFEEVAKFRAARRMWAKIMKDKYGAQNPRSWQFRFAIYTAGSTVIAQQPLNNIVRIAYEALAAQLGGAQSISLPSYLEAVSLPTEESARVAVATQQIMVFETGTANVADPLGGSYYIEWLTDKLEEEANKLLREIEDMGGMEKAHKKGWINQMIEKALIHRQKEIENGERIVVGLNHNVIEETETPGGYFRNPTHAFEEGVGDKVISDFEKLKETRDNKKVEEVLRKLYHEAQRAKAGEQINLYPTRFEAAKAYASMAEVMGTIRLGFGYPYDPFNEVESPFQFE